MDDSKIGRLAMHRDMSPEAYKVFIDIIASQDTDVPFKFLADIVDDKYKMLEIFDVLADTKVKFPSSNYVERIASGVNIWWFLKKRSLSPEDIKLCAVRHNRKPKQCEEIYERIDKIVMNMYRES